MSRSTQGGAGMVEGAPRPLWWTCPTISFFEVTQCMGVEPQIGIALVLPDGTRIRLGAMALSASLGEVRRTAAKKFLEVWNHQRKRRRRL